MEQILHNIKAVMSIEAYHLTHCELLPGCGIFMNVPQVFSKIPTIGLSSVEITDAIENKRRVFTTKLIMTTLDKLLPGNKKFSFKVTDVMGNDYLIGTANRPYPVVTNKDNYPSKATTVSGNTVTITWKSLYPMLQILD